MKRLRLMVFGLLCTLHAKAQWEPNSSPQTGNIYYNGGNVGIGTGAVAPVNPLQIEGSISELNLLIKNTGTNGARTYLTSFFGKSSIQTDKDFTIRTNYGGWSDRFILTNSGDIGIGSVSPVPNSTLTLGRVVGNPNIKGANVNGGHVIIDSYDATGGVFLNNYTSANVYLASGGGKVGIGTESPLAKLDVGSFIPNGTLGTVLGRLQEGNATGGGTFLGVRGYGTQPTNVKSFGIEHSFYGIVNSSINFYRGGGMGGGFLTFNTNDNSERMRIDVSGNVGIGTASPSSKLHLSSSLGSTFLNVEKPSTSSEGGIMFSKAGSTLFYLWNDDSNDALKIEATGQSGESDGTPRMEFPYSNKNIYMALSGGNVGIGTNAPGSFKLAVNGKVWAQEVQVAIANPGPDYVFEPDYKLLSLEEIKNYIDQHKHLPEVPSAKEMETNGVNVSEMNMILLKKIEELTLYVIGQSKTIQEQSNLINKQSLEIVEIKKQLDK